MTNIFTILIIAAMRDDVEINETRLLINLREDFCKESRENEKVTVVFVIYVNIFDATFT